MKAYQLPEGIKEVLIARLVELNFTPEDIETALDSKVSDVAEAALIEAELIKPVIATVETTDKYIIVTPKEEVSDFYNTIIELGYKYIYSKGHYKKDNNLKQRTLLHEAAQGYNIEFKKVTI